VKQAVAGNLRARAADAVLHVLGGAQGASDIEDDVSLVRAARTTGNVFAPAERRMVGRVLRLAERPVRTIMTPAPDVIWLEADDDAQALSRRLLRAGHAAYPVCRGGLSNLLGVARASDLICDLLEKGRIGADTLDRRPLTFPEHGSVLQVVERMRAAHASIAIVNGRAGTITGIVTSTDLLETILGRGQQER
jgi:CBS domain containing-hemolysin-like protein